MTANGFSFFLFFYDKYMYQFPAHTSSLEKNFFILMNKLPSEPPDASSWRNVSLAPHTQWEILDPDLITLNCVYFLNILTRISWLGSQLSCYMALVKSVIHVVHFSLVWLSLVHCSMVWFNPAMLWKHNLCCITSAHFMLYCNASIKFTICFKST